MGCTHLLQVTQGISTESPLPLWERDRVRGLAPAGADESVSSQRSHKFGQARQTAHRTVRSERVCFALPRESPHPVPLPQGERGLCRAALRQHGFVCIPQRSRRGERWTRSRHLYGAQHAGSIMLTARLRRAAELIAALLFAIMLGAFLIQVFTRYVLNDPASWTLEVCSIAYVWIVFFASAVIVDQRQHITFDMLYKSVNPRRRRIFAVISTASILVMFAVGLPGTLDYIAFMSKKYSLMLHIRMDLLYSCFGLFVIGAIVASALRLRRLFGRDWQKEL